MSSVKKDKIYIFDANAFIELGQIDEHVMELPQDVWEHLEKMLDDGQIISSRYVYDEVVINPQKPNKPQDSISKWLAPKMTCFTKENQQQVLYMIEVVKEFPKLIDPAMEKSQADPWLVAMIRDYNEQHPKKQFVLVTQENPASSTKLPAACKKYGAETINLRQFFQETGIKFGVV